MDGRKRVKIENKTHGNSLFLNARFNECGEVAMSMRQLRRVEKLMCKNPQCKYGLSFYVKENNKWISVYNDVLAPFETDWNMHT
jgi:hypothetical protein